MADACTIRLLGGFTVDVNDIPVPASAWRHRRGADLVKLLALQPGHALVKDQLSDAIWPGLDAEAAAANLRKAVHYARAALGSRLAIEAHSEMIWLWPQGRLQVDVEEFEAAARTALESGENLEAAAQLYRGELLPTDRYADWTEPQRERLRSLCLKLWRAAGRWDRVLELDRSDEQAHRALMGQYFEAGDRPAVIRQFHQLRDVLRVDLGVGPEEATVELFEKALTQGRPLHATVTERAQGLLARGLMAWGRGEVDQAESTAQVVREMALSHGLARELGEASSLLGMAAFAKGRWRERFQTEFDHALRLSPEQAAEIFEGQLCLAETTLHTSEATAVAQMARELLVQARRAGSLHGQALVTLLVGEAELIAGRLLPAEEWLVNARGLAEQAGSASAQVLALVRLAEVAGDRGETDIARAFLQRAQPLAEVSELAPHLVVRVLATRLSAAPDEQTLDLLDDAEASFDPGAICGPCSIGFRIQAAMAYAHHGELSRARHSLAAAEGLAGIWQAGPWRAATWEARSAVRAAEGDAEAAAGLLHEAAQLFNEFGRTRDAARCLDAVGALHPG
ncbi:MAG: hypothetical protein NVS1B3_17440 [Candidatus Dormibacteraceae bacterium]